MQESGGNPLFLPQDNLFKSNMLAAQRITTLSSREIVKIVTLPEVVGTFTVPKEMAGKVAKFRLESVYWAANALREPSDRFRISSSWGLTQVIGSNISKGSSAGLNILHFSANIEWQLHKAADMLENLLLHSKGNINHMYRGYNSGRIDSSNPQVIARANKVEQRIHGF